jgi:MGT family glycosyltransferase
MSTIAFLSIAMHGRVNPTLPVVNELVRRGHRVLYFTSPAFRRTVEATGATAVAYRGGDQPLPDPPTPATWIAGLAQMTLQLVPSVLTELDAARADLVVHDSACVWGAVAAAELRLPAASSFTTFAFNRRAPSPTRASRELLSAALQSPRTARRYVGARIEMQRRFATNGVPPIDLGNIRQPLNLVFTSRTFQPAAEEFDRSYRFVGPSIGARPADASFSLDSLIGPVVYVSLGTVFQAEPQVLATLAAALAPVAGTVVISTGQTDPAALDSLPGNVIARRFVPQPEVLARADLFVTHGGMNGANEALYAGVPMLVVPQGADQPLVASRVVELGAGLSLSRHAITEESVRARAERVLSDAQFAAAAQHLQAAQLRAGGFARAADELEYYLHAAANGSRRLAARPRG